MKANFKSNKYSEEFIREYIKNNKLSNDDWYYISRYQKLTEGFIREFKDYVYWLYISKHQKLTEEFIGEFKDKVVWNSVSRDQELTEEFIREFKDYVDWDYVCFYKELSISFIDEMIQENIIHSTYYKYLLSNKKINQEELIAYFFFRITEKIMEVDFKNNQYYIFLYGNR